MHGVPVEVFCLLAIVSNAMSEVQTYPTSPVLRDAEKKLGAAEDALLSFFDVKFSPLRYRGIVAGLKTLKQRLIEDQRYDRVVDTLDV